MSDWCVLYTAKPWVDEPAEGEELEYEAKVWRGEGQKIEYRDDYMRMPCVALKEVNVVAGSLTVRLKTSGQKVTVDDKTAEVVYKSAPRWPITSEHKCYARRGMGEGYDECHLFFHPNLDGEEVDVLYQYYLADAAIVHPVAFKGELYFNEAGARHRFLKLVYENGDWKFENTYSPRVGDRELTCVTPGDDRLWAISGPSYLVVQFAKEWAGYVHEVDGKGKKIWQIVADLARAGDQYCFDRFGILYVVNRATPTKTGTFPHVLKITRKDLPPYERVTFSYANGKVELGSGKPELSLNSMYVYDKGHADVLCRKAYEYYTVRRREYTVECAGILEQIGLCEEKRFEYLGKAATGIIVGRQFSPKGTTTFTVVEKAAQGEGTGGGGGGSTQEA